MMKGSQSFHRPAAYIRAKLYGYNGRIIYLDEDRGWITLTENQFNLRCLSDAMVGDRTRVRVRAGREVIE